MFWRFGGYANISTLNTILEKPDVQLDEILDEADLIQELKGSNSKLLEYLRDDKVLSKLLEYVVAPETPRPGEDDDEESSEDEAPVRGSLSPFRRSKDAKPKSKKREELEEWEKVDKTRTKLAYTSCEILSSETWSIIDSLMENQQYLKRFWEFVRTEPPLGPTEAAYFTKINEMLLDKKTEEMVQFLQSLDGIVPAMLNHIDCAAIMDLLLKIISMEKSEGGVGVVDWLQAQDLVPKLLSFMEAEHAPATQTAAGDFLKAIVTISANASQNEQSCIGPNNLTRQLVSKTCMDRLLLNMLRGGNPLTVGVGLIIEIIRKNNSDYDPDVGSVPDTMPSSYDPIYLGTMLRAFAERVPEFMALLLSSTHTVSEGNSQVNIKRKELGVAFGNKIEPLGFDRFKTCELMAELLHCSNMGLLNERGSEHYIMQRDEEREKLKSEGRLKVVRPPESAVTEFSEGSTSFANGISPIHHGSGHQEDRKLGIANNSTEEDGFEDVGHPADDLDELRDDFDEKSPFEIEGEPAMAPQPLKALKPRLDLDEDFVDEPLSSPRLEPVDDKDVDMSEEGVSDRLHPHSLASPASPTSGLTSAVDNLAVESAFDRMGEDPQTAQITLSPEPMSARLPSPEPELTPKEEKSSFLDEQGEKDGGVLSPHPEDQPAPLFAAPSKPELASDSSQEAQNSPKHNKDDSLDSIDTVQGMEGDSNRSLNNSGNEQSFEPQFEYDVDGRPIVGDYLKMMFVEHRVVPTILDFFFRFPWNNFLHNVVYDVVQQVFNGPMDRGFNRSLAIDLFQNGSITDRIIQGQAQSDEIQSRTNMRLGYMGHLTLVAEEVVKFSDRHPPEMLSQAVLEKVISQSWNDYVESTLSETRERDNAILGGVRPDMSLGPRQAVLNAVNAAGGSFGGGPSSALANAGLNGGAGLDTADLGSNGSGTSTAGFSGSLLSGFGSSSDEEDEEMEEIDDGDGQEPMLPLQSTHDATSSSPSDPPPVPPPLNLPPSRARRQLAARLAMHKAEAERREGGDGPSSDQPHSDDADGDSNWLAYKDEPHYDTATDDKPFALTPSPPTTTTATSTSDPPQITIESYTPSTTTTIKSPKSEEKKRRHLDLDDFANSPAADADDTASTDSSGGEDVEMQVHMG